MRNGGAPAPDDGADAPPRFRSRPEAPSARVAQIATMGFPEKTTLVPASLSPTRVWLVATK